MGRPWSPADVPACGGDSNEGMGGAGEARKRQGRLGEGRGRQGKGELLVGGEVLAQGIATPPRNLDLTLILLSLFFFSLSLSLFLFLFLFLLHFLLLSHSPSLPSHNPKYLKNLEYLILYVFFSTVFFFPTVFSSTSIDVFIILSF